MQAAFVICISGTCQGAVTQQKCNQPALHFFSDRVPDIHIVTSGESVQPAWKKNWDQARSFYKQKKYQEAREQYEYLLSCKNNIDQARWEYTSLLTCLGKWELAERELDILISHDADHTDYTMIRAEIALGSKNYKKAVHLLSKLFAGQCVSNGSTDKILKAQILSSYISALEGLGRIEVLIPLLEELQRLRPEDNQLRIKTADVALLNKQPEKALQILRYLEKCTPDDVDVIEKIANIYSATGKTEQAALYWQKIIGQRSDSPIAHKKLIKYYRQKGNTPMVLTHLEYLVKIIPNNIDILVEAGHLSKQTGMADRALYFYNKALKIQPDNLELQHYRRVAIQVVATKLFSLIENSGSSLLWRDLVEITTDREGIYRELAKMLRERRKNEELIEILRIINAKNPADEAIQKELAELLYRKNKKDELILSQKSVTPYPDITTR